MWFDNLPPDHRDEIAALLRYVRVTTNKPWPERVYDPLAGEDGISELKAENIRCERAGKVVSVTYRIYGFFGPTEHSYTCLHAWEKKAKNDRLGKDIAKGRLEELKRNGPSTGVCEFEYEKDVDSPVEERPRRPS
jgi:hypothetical protein